MWWWQQEGRGRRRERKFRRKLSPHTAAHFHLEEKWDALSVLAEVESSPTEELKLGEGFYRLYLNGSGAEVCLKAQCFLSLTCRRIKSKCAKGEGFLFQTIFYLGGGEEKQGRYFPDAAREDVKLVGVREKDEEVKAQTETDDDVRLWLNRGGAAQKSKGGRKCLSSSHWDTCEAASCSSRKHLLQVSTSVLLGDSECERAITEPLPPQLPVTWTWTRRKRWMSV